MSGFSWVVGTVNHLEKEKSWLVKRLFISFWNYDPGAAEQNREASFRKQDCEGWTSQQLKLWKVQLALGEITEGYVWAFELKIGSKYLREVPANCLIPGDKILLSATTVWHWTAKCIRNEYILKYANICFKWASLQQGITYRVSSLWTVPFQLGNYQGKSNYASGFYISEDPVIVSNSVKCVRDRS